MNQAQSTDKGNQPLPLSKKIMFSLLVLIVFFGILELGIRTVCAVRWQSNFKTRWYQYARLTGWFPPKPGVINSLGFHNAEITPDKPSRVFRILVLGGSAVFGEEPIDSSWVYHLEQLLNWNAKTYRYEVLNGGISGGTSNESLKQLRKTIEFDPDLVISYDGFNDIYASHYSPDGYQGRMPEYGFEPLFDEIRAQIFRRSLLATLINKMSHDLSKKRKKSKNQAEHAETATAPVFDNSASTPSAQPTHDNKVKKTLNIWGSNYDYTYDPAKPVPDHFSGLYQKNLFEIQKLLKRRRIPLVLIIQPNLAYSAAMKPLDPVADEILSKATGVLKDDWVKASAALYPKAESIVNQLSDPQTFCYSFARIFDGKEALAFTDSVHQANGRPKQMIAEKIQSLLLEHHLIPKDQ